MHEIFDGDFKKTGPIDVENATRSEMSSFCTFLSSNGGNYPFNDKAGHSLAFADILCNTMKDLI